MFAECGAENEAGAGLFEVYPARPESIAVVRAVVVEFATRVGAARATIVALKLAVSEAATNVVVHAYRANAEPGEIEVAATVAGDELSVVIADTGCGLRPRPDSPGLGLGLGIIAQSTDGLDVVRRSSGGLELRMRFKLPAQPKASR